MTEQASQLPEPPRPEPPLEHRPYWDGLREHRLVLQRCARCGKLRHYPRPVCDACYSMDVEWSEVEPRGTVHSWTVTHHPFHPGFKRQVPYCTVTVDLAEGVRLQAPLRDATADALAPGLAVTIAYDDIDADLTLPCVRLVGKA
ncbi:MAG: Zn-ribbon domain-containing OB-fold protein [Gammaproteobacteria bacterium]